MATTFDLFYLGIAPQIDTFEGSFASENHNALNGLLFGSAANPLALQLQTLSPAGGINSYTQGADATAQVSYEANNNVGSEGFFINGGALQIHDATMLYANTVIRYTDGTTATVTAMVMQDTAGRLYLLPPPTASSYSTALEAKPIQSVTLGTASPANGTDVYAMTADRYDLNVRDFAVDGTAAGDLIDVNYVGDTEGDRIDNTDALNGSNNDYVLAGTGNDSVFAGAGDDLIYLGDGDDRGVGGDGNDTIFGEVGNDSIEGGLGNDVSYGGIGSDTIVAGGGADLSYGGDGDDSLTGETGNDTLYGDAGNDTLDGDSDNDSLFGGLGDDRLIGDTGDDTLYGGDGADSMTGGDGVDQLYGDANNDTLNGGVGNDQLFGGADADTLTVGVAQGNDTVQGGETGTDFDTLSFSGASNATVTLTGNEAGTASYADGGAASFSEIERILTGSGNDTINAAASNSNLVLESGAGDDSITGGAGSDSLYGGIGTDTVFGGDGNDWASLGEGNDSFGTFNADSAGNDTIYGDAGDDYIITGGENDVVYGGTGNDSMSGGIGNDTLYGDDDADTFLITDDHQGDTIFGGEGGNDNDTLIFSNYLTTNGVNITATGSEGGTYQFQGSSSGTSGTYSGLEGFIGTGYQDNLDFTADGAGVTAYGSGGADVITGGAGNDMVDGGADADTFFAATGFGQDTVIGGQTGNNYDTLDLSGLTNPVSVVFTAPGAGVVTDTVTGETITFSEIEQLILSPQADVVDAYLNEGYTYIQSLAGNDLIFGSDADDAFDDEIWDPNGQGNDTFYGGGGNDVLWMGNDDDLAYGGTGNDFIGGEGANDSLLGGDGDDTVEGHDGNDTLHGDAGNDQLVGGVGADSIFGGAGNDTLFTGTGNDKAYGGDGDDMLLGGLGAQTLYGDAGEDILFAEGNTLIYGGTGNDILVSNGTDNQVFGDEGNDTVYGSTSADWINSGDDADVIEGAAGDTVFGGEGGLDNDTLVLNYADVQSITYGGGTNEAGTVNFYGGGTLTFAQIENISYTGPVDGTGADEVMGAGFTDINGDQVDGADGNNDIIFANGGNDTVNAGAGDDLVYGGTGDDVLSTQTGNDSLYGDSGNDTLLSGSGADLLNGGDGADQIQVFANSGADTVVGGEGNDTGFGDILYVGVGSADTIVNFTGDEAGSVSGGGTTASFSEIETVWTAEGNDTINASAASSNTNIWSGAGNDFVTGSSGNDYIAAQAGADDVFSGSGNDSIYGDIGADQLYAGDGNDHIYGGADNDYAQGDAGNDYVFGGTGDDFLRGDAGDDTVTGGMGNDTVYGGADSDLVYGDDGNDQVFGGFGTDTVYGGAGNDSVTGSGGNDEVYGDEGDDFLQGSDGNDTIYGGAGNDTLLGEEDADTFHSGVGDYIDGGEAVTTGTDNDTLNVQDVDYIVWDVLNPENGVVYFNGGGTLQFYNIEHVFVDGEQVFPPNFVVDGTAGNDWIDVNYAGDPEGDRIDAADNPSGNNDDLVQAGAGNDSVYTTDGNDTVFGDTGDDLLQTGLGNDLIYGGDGNDRVFTENGSDTVYGGAGNDSVYASFDGDLVYGGEGDDSLQGGGVGLGAGDTLHGDAGNDTLNGGPGADVLYGGADADLLQISGALDGDTLVGGEAGQDNDTLDLGALNSGVTITFTGSEAGSISNLSGTAEFSQIEQHVLTGYADNLDGSAATSGLQVNAGAGDDTLIGGTGADTLLGGSGRDVLSGGIGDQVDGGEAGDDFDTLDLSDWGHAGTNIIYDVNNPENGTVEFLDGDGNVIGSMTFSNIESVVACFTPGSMILTDLGERPVESLQPGDRVLTRDNGFQTLRWIGRRDLSHAELIVEPRFNPVRIAKGALGVGLPDRDMMVSPQHRILMTGPRAELLFGENEVLVAAKHLVGMAGVEQRISKGISYIHLLFDQHEIVRADGAWSESFQPGSQTLEGIECNQRAEVMALFPELANGQAFTAARLTLKAREVRVLIGA